MSAVTLELEGAKELERVLKRLPLNVQKKHLRRAVRQGAALVRNEARAAAPKRSGKLRKNIRSKGRRGKRFYVAASVFVNVAERTPQKREISGRFMSSGGDADAEDPKDAFYWRFLEFGTKRMSAQPFIRPAADRMFRRVVDHVVSETDRGVRSEIKRA